MKKKREIAIVCLEDAAEDGNLQQVKNILQNYEIANINGALFVPSITVT